MGETLGNVNYLETQQNHMAFSEKNSVFLELSSLNSNESIESKIDLAKHGKKGSSKAGLSGSTDISFSKNSGICCSKKKSSKCIDLLFTTLNVICFFNSIVAGYLAFRV